MWEAVIGEEVMGVGGDVALAASTIEAAWNVRKYAYAVCVYPVFLRLC